jgi:hypothetical protein
VRLGRLALITALAAALCAPAALAAPGKRLAKASDSGTPLSLSTTARALTPKSLLVRITATPNQPVEVIWDTSCSRKVKGKVREGEYTITGRKLRKIKKGFKRPTDCLINVFAAYETAGQEGNIKIEVFARGPNARRG